MATCPDVDNSWVLAGSESLPVETLGPEPRVDPESERALLAPGSPPKAVGEESPAAEGEGTLFQTESPQCDRILPGEPEVKGPLGGGDCDVEPPGPGDAVVQEDSQETPETTSLGPDTQDLGDQSPLQSLSTTPKAVWVREEGRCSSSTEDDTEVDVEGLRRRRGRKPSPPRPGTPLHVEDQARGESAGGELGLSLNMCLLGALVLLGLGVLLFSGDLLESDTGPTEEADLQVFPDPGSEPELVDAAGDGQERPRDQLQAAVPADSTPSLQHMGLLLDKLAKENQDIRLLQAQLQAQKEELQSLLQQPRGLEEENARLRGALQQGEASQRALESELQQLRTRLQGLEASCIRGTDGLCLPWGREPQPGKATKEHGPRGQEPDPGFLEQKERLEAEAQALRQELQRQRRLLGSVQQDLQRSLQDASRGAPAHAGLAELGHRLAQTLQGLEIWGQDPVVSANVSEVWHQKPHFQNSREWSGKEKWRDGQRDRKAEHWRPRREESGWERKKSWGDKEDRELAGKWKEGKPGVAQSGGRKDGKRQDPREAPRRGGSPHSGERQKHPRWREETGDGHAPLPAWEELSKRRFRAPQGCSGVTECARQEGLAFFGTELAPVRQQELASLLTTYLARLPWAGQLMKELPLSPAYFGEGGIFRHDRLRFRDFVDALEDSLEEAAVRQTGDDDEVDDFEDFIFTHFFGERALKRRSGKKDKHLRKPRDMGPREEPSHRSHPHPHPHPRG
ncbi:pre-B-cell leukemia transcription factor-interacting protein 1 isoform X1 [Marmota marmota marmota]|uniref:PBX homeobox interacting protein 1 n=1 Tax=Marmota marmota marmota TaxID=9994 RepID=A0A8C6EW35_MARMA|nr:pre-B-cell leukemia transcription factor-interacting protein 1 isoform X1 [Marmota marmota marmota]XP_015358298.1 pre-B-cell leukemia transcription factor-interacting protein 1 isoform X1 [Marmota marmota marmota]